MGEVRVVPRFSLSVKPATHRAVSHLLFSLSYHGRRVLEVLERHVGARRQRKDVGQAGHAVAAVVAPVDPSNPGLLLGGDSGLLLENESGDEHLNSVMTCPGCGRAGLEEGTRRGAHPHNKGEKEKARVEKTALLLRPPAPHTHHPSSLSSRPPPHPAHQVIILHFRQVRGFKSLFCEDRPRGGPGGPVRGVVGVPGRVGRVLGHEDEHVFLNGNKSGGRLSGSWSSSRAWWMGRSRAFAGVTVDGGGLSVGRCPPAPRLER